MSNYSMLLIVGLILGVVLPLKKSPTAAPSSITYLTISFYLSNENTTGGRVIRDTPSNNNYSTYDILKKVIPKWGEWIEESKLMQIRLWYYTNEPSQYPSKYFDNVTEILDQIGVYFGDSLPPVSPNQEQMVKAYGSDQNVENDIRSNSFMLIAPSIEDYVDIPTMINDINQTAFLLKGIIQDDIFRLVVIGPDLNETLMEYYGLKNSSQVEPICGNCNDTNFIDNIAGSIYPSPRVDPTTSEAANSFTPDYGSSTMGPSTPYYEGSTGLQTYQIALIVLGGIIIFIIIVDIGVRIYKYTHQQSNERSKIFNNMEASKPKLQAQRKIEFSDSKSYKENHTTSIFNGNQITISKMTSSEQIVKTQVASTIVRDPFHLDLSTLTNQGTSSELKKLMQDKNINFPIFPDIAKIYLFNIAELEYLGMEVTRHQVKKYKHLPTGIKLAIKYLPIPQGRYSDMLILKTVLREIENMRLLSTSPNIIDFYGLCLHEAQALLCMELMDLSLRDLYHIMHREKKIGFPEKLVGYIFVKIVDALNFCKSKGVMHRDIKPSNILVNYSGEIKLCDFGESRILNDSLASTNVGTILYWPPERFSYQYTKYDVRADIWSLGITLMEIIIGRLPYLPNNNVEQTFGYGYKIQQYIINTNFVEVIESYIRQKCSEILCHVLEMCTKSLDERPKLGFLINSEFYAVNRFIGKNEIAIILKDLN